MPQWAGSSWYYLRYTDPKNKNALASHATLDYWTPVDWYNGGMEHTTLHLLYSRFWHKFLYDIGVVPTSEPYAKRTSQGMILGEDGQKMSKSRGNVVNPDDIIAEFGADTLRLYIMFIGDFEKTAPWSQKAVKGCKRFLDRVWNLSETPLEDHSSFIDDISVKHETAIHRTIKKVGSDIENLKFNTAIAALMALVNDFYINPPNKADIKILLTLLSPFAPHIVEELWEIQGFDGYAAKQTWPEYDEEKTLDSSIDIAVQVMGKLRGTINIPHNADDSAVIETAVADERIARYFEGKEIIRTIIVKNKLINLIVK